MAVQAGVIVAVGASEQILAQVDDPEAAHVIDAAGKVAKAFTAVKPEGHDKEVLAAVAALK